MGIRKVRKLVASAMRDLEMGERYARLKEDAVASLLYKKARERVLKALFMIRTKREPPVNVSERYLANKVRMPAEMSAELSTVEQEEDEIDESGETFVADSHQRHRLLSTARNRISSRYRVTKRLIYYAMASVKI